MVEAASAATTPTKQSEDDGDDGVTNTVQQSQSFDDTDSFVSCVSKMSSSSETKNSLKNRVLDETLSLELSSTKSPHDDNDKKSGNETNMQDIDKNHIDHEKDTAPTTTTSSWLPIGICQVLALLRKNLLTKYRTPTATIFELFSPLMMMLILVLAYTLSEITTEEAKLYSSIGFDIPGPWVDLVRLSLDFVGNNNNDNNNDDESSVTERRRSRRRRNLQEQSTDLKRKSFYNNNHKASNNIQNWNDIFINLQDQIEENVLRQHEFIMKDDEFEFGNHRRLQEQQEVDLFDLLDDASAQLADILSGPVPIPTLSQYVGISTAISSLIGAEDIPRIVADSSIGFQWGNLLTLGTLHLSPDIPITRNFLTFIQETYPSAVEDDTSLQIQVHATEKKALDYINDNLEERTWALVDFTDAFKKDDEFSHKIRMNYTTIPNTNEITSFVTIGLNTDYQQYYLSGFLTLQRTLNEFSFSLEEGCNSTLDDVNMWSMPMPTAAYSQNPFFLAVGYLLGLTIVMAYLYPTSRLIKTIVEEKELRMKETLFILGVGEFAYWLSWLLTSILVYFVITITVTWTLSSNILTYSDPAYIFVYIALFSSSTIGFCFTVAALFSRAKLAAIIGPMALFATILPRFVFFGFNRYEATNGKLWASLLPPTAFAFAADIVADYEYSEQGIQAWNASEGDYSFNTSLGFLFFDTILFIFLGWYLEQVIPRQYGVARPFYFIFLPSYWCSCFVSGHRDDNNGNNNNESTANHETNDTLPDGTTSQDFEDVRALKMKPGVEIKNLVKKYTSHPGRPPAVNNLNLTLYESQITALLGHNGAGKTSTVSVLTGLFPPTQGDCIIYGNSISQNVMEARQSIGICPQHNILFDSLTVYEHLVLFQRIKGIRPTHQNVISRAQEIGLGDYIHTASLALSGGNKRKLSVAIALSGDPKVLILDEPTSAMDPRSRRAVWELLRKKRNGRVTLLTTHFMDEAELLSDRIAVMKGGKLQCFGSAVFLKDRFGLGYNLTAVLDPFKDDKDLEQGKEQANMLSFEEQYKRMGTFLESHVPGTKLARKSGREVSFRFPPGTEDLFAATFDALEQERTSLGIGAYGITNSTLEEVFLQLAEQEDNSNASNDDNEKRQTLPDTEGDLETPPAPKEESGSINGNSNDSSGDNDNIKYNGLADGIQPDSDELHHLSPLGQIGLLYWKRLIIQRRDLKGGFFAILLPVIVIALVLLVLTLTPPWVGPPIKLNPDLYKTSITGTVGETSVFVGGGFDIASSSSSEESSTNNTSVLQYEMVSQTIANKYEYTNFFYLDNTTNSEAMSQHLLETYNDKTHDTRYGAYVLQDEIFLRFNTNWDKLREEIESINDELFEENNGEIDIINALGIDRFRFNVTLSYITFVLNEISPFDGELEIDVFSWKTQTANALEKIFGSRPETSPEQWLEQFQSTINKILNQTIVTENTESLMLANLTDELFVRFEEALSDDDLSVIDDLTAFAGYWLDDVRETVQNSDFVLDDVVAWANEWNDELTSIVFRYNITNSDVTDLANTLFGDVMEVIIDDVIASAGKDINATLTNARDIINEFVQDEGAFDRQMIEEQVAMLAETVITSLGAEVTIDLPAFVANIMNFADNLFDNSAVSDVIVVAAILFADRTLGEIILEVGDDGIVTVEELQDYILRQFGDRDPYLAGEIGSITLTQDELLLSNITLETSSGILLDIENATIDLLSISNLTSLFPNGTIVYEFSFDTTASVLHNSSSPHAVAAYNQAFIEHLYGTCKADPTAKLVSINQPLPITTQESIEVKTILSVLASLFLLIPLCYIPGGFIVFLVKERVSKSKHLQLVSGVNMTSYWLATYLWDLTMFFVLAVATMLVLLAYGTESAAVFVGDISSFFASFLLIFGYGMSVLPFAYLLSRNFDNHSSAQISVIGVIFITGFVAVNAYFIMSSIEQTEDLAESLQPLFRTWPAYNVGEGFIFLSTAFWERELFGSDKTAFDWEVTGRSLTLVYCLSPVYFLLLLMLEYSQDGGSGGAFGLILRYIRGSYDRLVLRCHGVKESSDNQISCNDGLDEATSKDDDVLAEEVAVQSNPNLQQTAPVVLRNLWKIYPPSAGLFGGCFQSLSGCFGFCYSRKGDSGGKDQNKNGRAVPRRAIRGTTLGVAEGETMGLLGANGAGKSTTLGVLTGDISATAGEAYIAGHDVTGSVPGGVAEARKKIGFCPQTDPLLDLMTGRETLTMFAKLRGVQLKDVDNVVTELLDDLTLTPHADKTSESYSGGNKRKLSLGVAALVGKGGVLLIDESSSGLDPGARRKLWDLILELAKKRSVILTTHSMEEAEALCSRIGIMAKGQMVAIGSVQHLKTKYLDGYTIDMSCRGDASEADVDSIVSEMLEHVVAGSVLSERHGRYLRFDVSKVSSLGLGSTFRRLKDLKDKNNSILESYSISQCSLEQVFIKLVNESENAHLQENE